jgi:hypothetical protein
MTTQIGSIAAKVLADECERLTKSVYDCEECGKRRMNTPSGSVCPDGHGRLKPKIPRKELAQLERRDWMATLPIARPFGAGLYKVDGSEVHYAKVKVGRIKTGTEFSDGIAAVETVSLEARVIKLVTQNAR